MTKLVKRTPEEELMDLPFHPQTYASADFSEPNFVALFSEKFPAFNGQQIIDLGCGPADITFAEGAQTELMRLGEGDSISIQGALRVETYAKAGEKRVVAKLRRAA